LSGMVRPRAFAVLRLITSSNLVGWLTGRSDGFAPAIILPAGWDCQSERFGGLEIY
jgi:hypothetical protein